MASQNDLINKQRKDLFAAIALIQDAGEACGFLTDVFTEGEIQRASKRWCITRRLLDGDTNTSVQELCNVNKNTVSRARREIIRRGTGVCETIYERLKNIWEVSD